MSRRTTLHVLAIANQKGGVAKTSTAVNLATGLGRAGKRVLLIDTDPQANATFALLGPEPPVRTLSDVLIARTTSLADILQPALDEPVLVAGADISLSAADVALAAVPGRERLLARAIRSLSSNLVEIVVIDTPPSLGLLTVNSLLAAYDVLIPVGVGSFGLSGIALLEDTISQLRENFETDHPQIAGAVATLQERTRIADETLAALREHFGDRLFTTVIPKNTAIEEANSRSQSIFRYAPTSRGGLAYAALTQEVLTRGLTPATA